MMLTKVVSVPLEVSLAERSSRDGGLCCDEGRGGGTSKLNVAQSDDNASDRICEWTAANVLCCGVVSVLLSIFGPLRER
jgi:hypothetical protein